MFLCICKSISDTQIREAVDQGARTIASPTPEAPSRGGMKPWRAMAGNR